MSRRFGVTEKQYARAARKLEGILDARENAVGFRGSEQARPMFLRSHGKGVDVTRCAGPAEDRSGDAPDDHCRDTGGLEPLTEIGEGGDKQPWNALRHGNARRVRCQRSRTSATPASRVPATRLLPPSRKGEQLVVLP